MGLQCGQTRSKLFRILSKGGNIRTIFPCHIALRVDVDIGQALTGRRFAFSSLEEVCPGRIDGIAVCGVGIIDHQVKHLIQLILLIFDCAFYSNRIGFNGKCRGGQRKEHDQSQQEAGKFFHVLHFVFSFLSLIECFLIGFFDWQIPHIRKMQNPPFCA